MIFERNKEASIKWAKGKILILTVCALALLGVGTAALAAQTEGQTRDISVQGITVTVGGKTISNVVSDPIDYYEIVDNNTLADLNVIPDSLSADAPIIYTALYPYTTTGRQGNYVEYVCQKQSSRYYVTSVNTSGDGKTYIPVGGFVLSLPAASYSSLAKVGDQVKLSGSSLTLPTKVMESESGCRVVINSTNAKRTGPMVVYYDSSYGDATGTNIYGTELICTYDYQQKSFVISGFRDFLTGDASGSEIPNDGFVLSAYGVGYRQLLARGHLFRLGDKVKLTGISFLSVSESTLNSTYNSISSQLSDAIKACETRKNALYDLNTELIDKYVTEAEAELDQLRLLKDQILSDAGLTEDDRTAMLMEFSYRQTIIEELCYNILTSSAESKPVSARAVWHRPCESTYEQIKANLTTLKSVGINLVFVETFYHGCSAFKSSVSDFPYHSSLALSYTDKQSGKTYSDYLSAFVACCEDLGIEAHAWVENFYVGIDTNSTVVREHPDWIMYNDDGSYLQRNEGGLYIFIDPANKQVQDTLINYYIDLLDKNPGIKGLNLDYIRYPVSSRSQDTGYTVEAMVGFYSSLGYSFTEAQLADRAKMANKFKQLFDKNYLLGGQTEADRNYNLWVQYRTEIITDVVRRIKDEVKGDRDIYLSTAVFASLSESLNSKKADWQSWFKDGWIDIATPMAYYSTASAVGSNVLNMISSGGSICLYYTGLANSYSGLPAWQNKEFVEASYNAGANGYVIFSSAQILGHNDVQLALSNGVNGKWAVLPHADVGDILSAALGCILDRADRLYVPAGGMTAQGRAELEVIFGQILDSYNGSTYSIYLAYTSLDSIADDLGKYAIGSSYQRISEQLNELIDLLDTRISMKMIADGDWDPESGEARPEVKEEIVEKPDNGENDPEGGEEKPEHNENLPDNGGNDSDESDHGTENEKKVGFFGKFFRAIANFFKKLFGGLFGRSK